MASHVVPQMAAQPAQQIQATVLGRATHMASGPEIWQRHRRLTGRATERATESQMTQMTQKTSLRASEPCETRSAHRAAPGGPNRFCAICAICDQADGAIRAART